MTVKAVLRQAGGLVVRDVALDDAPVRGVGVFAALEVGEGRRQKQA